MNELREYLASIDPDSTAGTDELESVLMRAWDAFDGSDEGGMVGYKLRGRMQDVVWRPPMLTFTIERHGGTVLGSSRAETQRWELDLDARTASCDTIGFTMARPTRRALDVEPMAQEVVRVILKRDRDERIRWNADGSVRVHIGKILPANSAVKQTLAARRKRFREAVKDALANAEWEQVRPNVYRPVR